MKSSNPPILALSVAEVEALAAAGRWNDLFIRIAENVAAHPDIVRTLTPEEVDNLYHLLLLTRADGAVVH